MKNTAPIPAQCPDCGAAIPPGQPKGLCATCALKGALELSNGESQVLKTEDSANASPPQPVTPVGQLPTLKYFGDYELAMNGMSPEQIFDRRWAQTVMERALSRLREEYVAGGKEALFEQLKEIQPGEHGESSYAEIGARLGLAEGTVKSAVHRLRRRHRELLREEIAQTVARPEEIDEEIRNLLTVLSR